MQRPGHRCSPYSHLVVQCKLSSPIWVTLQVVDVDIEDEDEDEEEIEDDLSLSEDVTHAYPWGRHPHVQSCETVGNPGLQMSRCQLSTAQTKSRMPTFIRISEPHAGAYSWGYSISLRFSIARYNKTKYKVFSDNTYARLPDRRCYQLFG